MATSDLSPAQEALLRKILSRPGARRSPKLRKAAVETALVESNASNPSGGDADSAGWRQERRSLYPNPTNVTASADRFFREAAAVKGKYGTAGALAAAVQRPAAQYRGRYQAVSGKADQILAQLGKSTPSRGSSSRTVTTSVPGSTTTDKKAAVVAALLSHPKPGSLMKAVQANIASGQYTTTTPGTSSTTTTKLKAAAKGKMDGGFAKRHSPLKEEFWQGAGGIDVKNGKRVPQGFVEGHQDHVHVAAGPKTVVELGKLAQKMGLHVGENPHFGGVAPVHAKNSYHYRGEAIDVSGDAKLMRKYASKVAQLYGIKR
jgi:hypothetical protein